MIDLSRKWYNADRAIWKHVAKRTKDSGSDPPSLNKGAIFSNGSSLWLYGGYLSKKSPEYSRMPTNGIWRYDIATDQWTQPPVKDDNIQRLFGGTTVQAGNLNAFYLGGVTPDNSSTETPVTDPKGYQARGLLAFDESEQSFSNISTVTMNTFGTVEYGYLSYIEFFGSKGVLVTFGGSSGLGRPYGASSTYTTFNFGMKTVAIYDIASQSWYQQPTTGEVPLSGNGGCSVAVSAADHSSHSIYVFGGLEDRGELDDQLYILSLPSFIWIRVPQGGGWRSGHKCHVMGSNHMLVVGGSNKTACDSGPRFSQGLGIFSLNDHEWRSSYEPTDGSAPYYIHSSISSVIGGDTTGGATKLTPEDGYSSDALRIIMQGQGPGPAQSPKPTQTAPSTANSAPQSSSFSHTGVIIGSVIGGAVLVSIILGLIWFNKYRLRRSQQQHTHDVDSNKEVSETYESKELEARSKAHELRDTLGHHDHELSDSAQRYEIPNSPDVFELPG
ncbi:MAG: hypothetical protein Q9219_006102 [cf. Caloplaca sp. 3 TL-2023]